MEGSAPPDQVPSVNKKRAVRTDRLWLRNRRSGPNMSNSVDQSRRATLVQIMTDNGGNPLDEVALRNHWHLRFSQ